MAAQVEYVADLVLQIGGRCSRLRAFMNYAAILKLHRQIVDGRRGWLQGLIGIREHSKPTEACVDGVHL